MGWNDDEADVRFSEARALFATGGMISREGAERRINKVDVGQLGEVDSRLRQQLPALVSLLGCIHDAAPQHPAEVIGAMLAEGVVVARAFPPYDPWVRITIGLPAENDQARAALRKVLATKP